jgi:hypothetical protein
MKTDDLVEVYTTTKAPEADLIRNLLEAEGIQCAMNNEMQAGLSGILNIPILVRPEDVERAKELIDSHGKAGRIGQDQDFGS